MMKNLRALASTCVCSGVLWLAACGGGGSDDPAPPAGPDTRVPTATLTSPANLAAGLTGTVDLEAAAADDVGVAGVEFEVDGLRLGAELTAPPYRASLDASQYAAGQHVVSVRSRDAAGNRSAWSSAVVRFGGSGTVNPGFALDQAWVTGLTDATALAQAPDGRLFVAQQGGALRVVKDGVLLAAPFHTFTVDPDGERGLIGVALHPDFANNGFVYVHYTSPAGGAHNRISRLVAAGSGDTSTGTESVLVDLPALSAATNHNGGAIHFGADGKLYVGVGDNHQGSKAPDLSDPFGKLLRFNDDGGIPTDNPHYTTQAGIARAVWAHGLRNPFTFAVQPGTGRIHINDVGEDGWEEVNLAQAGAHYGWPSTEGPTTSAGIASPLFAYRHSDASPAGSGPGGFFTGFSIAGGAFYPAAGPFPAAYHGQYFFADFVSRFVARLDPASGQSSVLAHLAGNPVDMLAGADGALYVLTRGTVVRIVATP
jgi:glucose/arabinose dehydrogenase